MLLDAKCDMKAIDKYGQNAAHLAVAKGLVSASQLRQAVESLETAHQTLLGATLVATIKKASPKTWPKLFVADADPPEAPKLLDGLEGRSDVDGTKTRSKQEMLKDAKARAAAAPKPAAPSLEAELEPETEEAPSQIGRASCRERV